MITSAYTAFKSKKNINTQYLYYFFESLDDAKALKPYYKGLRKTVRPPEFLKIHVPFPPKVEQDVISQFLDTETSRIDNLIAKQEKLIELLEEQRKSIISYTVTKGLDPNAPMKDSNVEWLGEVPEHWDVKNYRFASKIYRGKFGHRPRNDPSLYDGEYPFIQTGDVARAGKYIQTYSQTLNEKGKAVSQVFTSGTLVMAIAANIGDTAILNFEAYAPDSVVGFKPHKNIDLEFLRFSFIASLQALKQTAVQSTQANLNVERIGALKTTFPPLSEQIEISNYLNAENEKINHLISKQNQLIGKLKEYRSSIISHAVTGKIDVREFSA
ncbi:restriction endonuclease subunit S [Acinetobacter sp. dk771]|uniref:Restriction endonuclease subunit S n=2 Tax=Acinetobacter wanghuae TaxID=2662362 RepID=A0AA90W4X9_9GAMM|nr:restriction endonuclease subunit S [Acinetobacter wanghuae]